MIQSNMLPVYTHQTESLSIISSILYTLYIFAYPWDLEQILSTIRIHNNSISSVCRKRPVYLNYSIVLFAASIAQQYHVSKYPTLKLFRHGQLMKREYRGQRSADALANYIKDMLKSTVNDVQDIDDLDNLDVSNCVLYLT